MDYNLKSLYESYQNDVFAYLLSFTHNKALAEDLTSEVFLTALISLHSFKGKSAIKTWLFGIARNKWYEYLRKDKKDITEEFLLYNYTLSDIDFSDRVSKNDCIKKIYEILSEINTKQKQIFFMRINGYSYAEIAEKGNISEVSARVTDFRVKNKVKEILIREGYGNE